MKVSKIDYMKWISVKDRLPEYKGFNDPYEVIITGFDDCTGKRFVCAAYAHDYGEEEDASKVFSVPGNTFEYVTHWMDLPEPPTE